MKNIIVTGASGNLGQAVVQKFLDEGNHVLSTLVPNDPAGIDIRGKNFETAIVDLMDEKASQQFVEFAAVKLGRIDAAILTVGGYANGNIADTTSVDISKQIKLNFETTYNIARPIFLQMMLQGSGRIFFIGAKPGLNIKNSKSSVAYGLSKSLIFRLAELMNEEAKLTNVVTSVVVPSTIDTPQNRKAMPEADFTKWVKAEAIAETIFFYCGEKAAIMRDPVIKVYGYS